MKRLIPNALTVLRAALCPLIVYLFINLHYASGLILFALATTTDFLDGYLARRWEVMTPFGAVLDPLCDKFYCIVFFSVLMSRGDCPAWFLGLVITVALLQSCGYLCLAFYETDRPVTVTSSYLGQWNTTFQYLWIGLLLVNLIVENRFPPAALVGKTGQALGYAFLSLTQIRVFYRHFRIYQVQLVPDFCAFSTLN
jgi:CDP-diacylglycerol--glycerol-3-phosphate 3-phosphatidyltransferase